MVQILSQEDFQPVEAENGLDALEILKTDSHFDVILSDVQMPKMDGIHLLEELQIEHPAIPVIMLSVNPKWNAEIAGKGACAYLPKPFSRRQLLDAVHDATHLETAADPA
jgi:CheY-like chemotaxis protein